MSKKNKKRKVGESPPVINWEEESYFPTKLKEEMRSMWEIPQIYQFLHLTKDILNIPNITIYEMERMLLIPKASKQLANIMTCLLSYSNRPKMNKVPPMPYEFWTNILMHKLNNWYKHYQSKHMDIIKVLEIFGVEPEFWNIFPDPSLFAVKDFEEFSFKQRVWLLKSLCDSLVHSKKVIQEKIANHSGEDQEEIILGTDSHGAKYIYFPQFISSELRIYKHCMNNTILSTANPIKAETTSESVNNKKVNNSLSSGEKVKKTRKSRTSRWQHGYCERKRKPVVKKIDKKIYVCNCSNNFISKSNDEDLHLSFTSLTNYNNNSDNSDNNNIKINNLDEKIIRSSSEISDESTMSINTKCSNTKSSDCETNVSNNDTIKENTFKGFSIPSGEKGDIVVINRLLTKLKTEMDTKHVNPNTKIENVTDVTNDAENSNLVLNDENNTETILNECDPNHKHSLDNLSNNSKTDDEKLNEIIVTGNNTILIDKTLTNNSEDMLELDSSFTSKSDDEKLNETETTITDTMKNTSNDVPDDTSDKCNNKKRKRSNNREINNANKKFHVTDKSILDVDETQNCIKKDRKCETNLQMEDDKSLVNDIINDESEITITEEKMEDIENNPDEMKNENNASFRIMLNKLGVSNFLLVADSVETLRELISSFPSNVTESPSSCEELLVNKLKKLLKSVEEAEKVLKGITKKAKAKLLKEWTNYQIGTDSKLFVWVFAFLPYLFDFLSTVCCISMEDQDSSGEIGVSSNWWILGSQDNELPTANDESTLQALPNSTLSSISTGSPTQSSNNQSKEPYANGEEKQNENTKDKEPNRKTDDGEPNIKSDDGETNRKSDDGEPNRKSNDGEPNRKSNDGEPNRKSNDEEPNRKSNEEEQEGRNNCEEKSQEKHQEDKEINEKKEGEEQTQRVLRARGVSSYTEQLYPYDEIYEGELDEWANFKTVYTPPSAQIRTTAPNSSSKNRHDDNWSEKEDSDQDWILPGSRKRKNKRSPNKKLRSLQMKNLNKKITTLQDIDKQQSTLSNNKDNNNKERKEDELEKTLKIRNMLKKSKKSTSNCKKIIYPQIQENSVRTISPVEAVKIGYTNSVHSELNIKDETPILDSVSNQCKTNYNVPEVSYLVQPNPTLIGISQQNTFVQANPIIPNILPNFQPNYYMQGMQPEYVLYNQQPNFLPIQQVPCIVTSQQIVNRPSCIISNARMNTSVQSTPKMNELAVKKKNLQKKESNSNDITRPNIMPRSSSDSTLQRKKSNNNLDTDKIKNKTTSLIILSDSDDEIEILNEKIDNENNKKNKTPVEQESVPEIANSVLKNIIPQEFMQRIDQGCISITPIKPTQTQSTSTQLVVVVNETGNYYALALPNGSKLILTPEQVAQIRASNGGKLIL
ncbi:hypothetical protein M0802_001759 [Mischocyttarus mexicanus]|nr:hypothetical protein M0802_001759 [Mischocyttarus mexicanus]